MVQAVHVSELEDDDGESDFDSSSISSDISIHHDETLTESFDVEVDFFNECDIMQNVTCSNIEEDSDFEV